MKDILENARILYIEDDELLAALLKAVIEDHGGNVDIVNSGTDGLLRHQMEPYDLIIIDYLLPGMSGVNITRKLTAEDPGLPIIMITAHGSEKIAAEAIAAGVSNYVIKGNPEIYQIILPAMIISALKRSADRREMIHTNNVLKDAFAGINEGFLYFDSDDRLVFANDKIDEIYPLMAGKFIPGASYENLLREGVAKGQWGPSYSMDEQQQTDEQWIKDRLDNHSHPEGSRSFHTPDGKTIQIEEKRTPLGGTAGVRTDVTKLVQALTKAHDNEQLLRTTVDAIANAITVKKLDGTYLLVNKAFARWFKTTPAKLIGKTITDLLPGQGDFYKNYDELALKTGQVIDGEQTIAYPDGKTRYVRFFKTPSRSENGDIFAITTNIVDLTEQKNLEKKLSQSQKMEAIGQLAGGVAHDFNNLMTVMMGNLELAMKKIPENDKIRKYIATAIDAVEKGSALTQQMLAFSRQQNLSPKNTDVRDLIAESLEFIERIFGEDIEIISDLSNEALCVFIDKGLFATAFLNLLNNARDAMPEGGQLTIETRALILDGDVIDTNIGPVYGPHIRINVTDTGIGMNSDVSSRVLEPFFTTKKTGEGTGLGLSMVYGFIQQSGGQMSIDSTKGEGTTVSIYLPATTMNGEKPEPAAESSGQIPLETALSEIRVKTILMVEDDQDVRDTTLALLKSLDYNVIEAQNGQNALNILSKDNEKIDMVLTDVVMPDSLSGIELAHYVYSKYKHIKILLVSGYPDRIRNHKSFSHLGLEILPKPFKRDQLQAALDRTWAKHNRFTDPP